MEQPQLKAVRKPRQSQANLSPAVTAGSIGVTRSRVESGLPNGARSTPAVTAEKGRAGQPKPDVYSPQCPAQKALDAIASKWAILIMHRLLDHPLRFNALQRELPGISQKVLTQQLRKLEKFGLLTRTVHATLPPSVEYKLTDAGRELKGALASLCEWATKHAVLLGLGTQDQTKSEAC